MNEDCAIQINSISKKYNDNFVLENISFQIKKGESIGIIGRNGAGKSTLLKIMAGIIKPTSGTVELYGKVTSILEIGSGLHQDLSGRENIILVAKLLGFPKKEINQKIEKIIEFNELEEYIDEPVKTYSNGMYLRLAFSIYSELNSDILLIDEILSVGDAAFKKKSLEVIKDFKEKGKTLILVSHNFNDINNYCDRIIYIDKYLKADSKSTVDVINQYLRENSPKRKYLNPNSEHFKKGLIEGNQLNPSDLKEESTLIELLDINYKTNGQSKTIFDNCDAIDLCIKYRKKKSVRSLQICIKIFDFTDTLLLDDSSAYKQECRMEPELEGVYEVIMKIPSNFFNAGDYFVTLHICEDYIAQETWHYISSFKIQLELWASHLKWEIKRIE